MTIKIFNTLTKKKEEFIPREKGKVSMYVCGPTVYNHIHIGNAHAYIISDVIKRYLLYKGYKVIHVQNVTDVDDKIINQSIEENLSTIDISKKYETAFWKVSDMLNILRPDFIPKATEHINEMIKMIEVLIDKEYAYVSDGDVYFSVDEFKSYGKLSKQQITELMEGKRVCVIEGKKKPHDFALWKASKPGEPRWNSPWGEGRPGWHIECSAMALKYLGEEVDIHAGGRDLIFPHHENEIAQSEAFNDSEPFVRYWVHNGLINMNKVKMSKSLKNWVFVKDVLKMYHPNVIRIFSLSTHYRKDLDYSPEMIEACNQAHEKLLDTLHDIDIVLSLEEQESELPLSDEILSLEKEADNLRAGFEKSMNDDFNTAKALSYIFKFVKELNRIRNIFVHLPLNLTSKTKQILKKSKNIIIELLAVLGVELSKELMSKTKLTEKYDKEKLESKIINITSRIYNKVLSVYPQDAVKLSPSNLIDLKFEDKIEIILSLRNRAREEKKWVLADDIRKMLKEIGISIKDTPVGTKWRFS